MSCERKYSAYDSWPSSPARQTKTHDWEHEITAQLLCKIYVNIIYFILWCFIAFTPPSWRLLDFQCEWTSRNAKRQKWISHTFLWSPLPAKLFSISNLIYDIESISPLWVWGVCMCVLVGLCLSVFALRSATIFHIFQHFFLRSFGLALMSGLDTANMNRGIEPKPPEPSFCFRSFFSQFSLPSDVLRRSTSKCQIENWWIPLIEFDRCQALSAAINLRQMYDVQRPSLGLKEDPECLGNYYKVDAGQKPCIPKIFWQNNLNTLRHRTKGVH